LESEREALSGLNRETAAEAAAFVQVSDNLPNY